LSLDGAIASPGPARRRVLVVDDDPTFRRLFQSLLQKSGCEVIAAEAGSAAQRLCPSPDAFDCAVVDYLMPGMDGIELIRWLHESDPALAALLVTAHGDKGMVERAWAAGACGFLDKPPTAADLVREVGRALERSRENRRMARMTEDLGQVANTQRAMLRGSTGPDAGGIRLTHLPFHEAGGDFLVRFAASETETLVLAADVSGHDLNAAFLAAHFQGLVRGMLQRAARLDEILEFFNHILLEEWSGPGAGRDACPPSIAVTALWIDSSSLHLTVAVNGNPLPVLVDAEGNVFALGEPGCPLGWFPGPATRPACYRFTPGSSVRLWTDGVEDLAERLHHVDPLAVVAGLHAVQRSEVRPPWLDLTGDDVMAATIDLLNPGYEPIIRQACERENQPCIDQWQERWRRSLRFALPGLTEESTFDILLVAREAVLNAVQHGCGPGEAASFTAAYDPGRKVVRLIVGDPGPGHDRFPAEAATEKNAERRHRGLHLIRALSRRVVSRRGGAELHMDLDARFDVSTS
jgi:CheY-like chemotaxis protein/anti-sigma regulatory factor (Ser/Thr protein kinase)